MSDNRKYYYLKLKENYFDEDAIVLLESMQDGIHTVASRKKIVRCVAEITIKIYSKLLFFCSLRIYTHLPPHLY